MTPKLFSPFLNDCLELWPLLATLTQGIPALCVVGTVSPEQVGESATGSRPVTMETAMAFPCCRFLFFFSATK